MQQSRNSPELRSKSNLDELQWKFIDLVLDNEGIILALPMSFGKTAVVLTALEELFHQQEIKKVLVIAPLKVAEATWPDEIEGWKHTAGLSYTLIRAEPDDHYMSENVDSFMTFFRYNFGTTPRAIAGEPKSPTLVDLRKHVMKEKLHRRRRFLANTDTQIHIINKEGIHWLWEHFGNGERWPYDVMVLDESTLCKNGRQRVKVTGAANSGGNKTRLTRFGILVKASELTARNILLTGTPTPKGIENLWGQVRLVDGGKRLGRTKSDFERRYYDFHPWLKYTKNLKPKAKETILKKVSDIAFSMPEDEVLKLPPITDYDFFVRLKPKVLDEYNNFKRHLVSEVYDVEAVNSGVLHMKLMQFANGSMYQEDGKDVWIHDEKLQALEAIVESLNGAPVLVAYNFKFDLKRIRKLYKKAVVFSEGDAREIKKRWNNGEIEMLLGHPASIGHGQNLQYGGCNSVWYGLTPDLELYLQFNRRLRRRGQTHPVSNYHILARETIDEDVIPILEKRDSEQQDVINALTVER